MSAILSISSASHAPFAAKLHVPDAALEAWPLPEELLIAGRP